jgi:hypothetical protein
MPLSLLLASIPRLCQCPCWLTWAPERAKPTQLPGATVQGKWLAFRSAAAGDRFLQARKRNPRLVFYNNNIGTWEQWELEDEAALEAAPWARTAVVLRHRRLPQVCPQAAASPGSASLGSLPAS